MGTYSEVQAQRSRLRSTDPEGCPLLGRGLVPVGAWSCSGPNPHSALLDSRTLFIVFDFDFEASGAEPALEEPDASDAGGSRGPSPKDSGAATGLSCAVSACSCIGRFSSRYLHGVFAGLLGL